MEMEDKVQGSFTPNGNDSMFDLIRRVATTESDLQAALAGEIDAVIDPTNATPMLLQEAQETLRQSMMQYRRLINRVGATIFELELDGTTLFVNPAVTDATGYAPREIQGHNWWDVFTPGDLRAYADGFLEAVGKGDVTSYELTVRGKDGSFVFWEVNTANHYDREGKLLRILGFATDATRRKKAEEANELKSRFLAMISHELRTPLTSIKGFATTLLADEAGFTREEEHEFIGIISEEADKLTALIEQLLILTRLQAGNFKLKNEVLSIQQLLDVVRPKLDELCAKHKLSIHLPETPINLQVDKQRIATVLSNLIHNACKYSPFDTPITVNVHVCDGMAQFDITDKGRGIKPEDREIVFEAFYQVTKRPWGELHGAGLGLAICQGLVKAHGGRIWVQAQEPDSKGTTISFSLPISPPHS